MACNGDVVAAGFRNRQNEVCIFLLSPFVYRFFAIPADYQIHIPSGVRNMHLYLIAFCQLQFGGFFFVQNAVLHPEQGLIGCLRTIESGFSPAP